MKFIRSFQIIGVLAAGNIPLSTSVDDVFPTYLRGGFRALTEDDASDIDAMDSDSNVMDFDRDLRDLNMTDSEDDLLGSNETNSTLAPSRPALHVSNLQPIRGQIVRPSSTVWTPSRTQQSNGQSTVIIASF